MVDRPPALPARDPHGHKGTFGTVLIVGGCADDARRMIGAPALAAAASLRAGAGLARLLMPTAILDAALVMCPSATGVPIPAEPSGEIPPHRAVEALDAALRSADVLAIGPGLGDSPAADALTLRAIQESRVPVVLDADALHALARLPEIHRDFRASAALTPHPGEFRALARTLRLSQDPTDPRTRPAAAEALAQRLGCVVVLKGARTVVSDGSRTWTNPNGHACLATAGTGDVLTGLLAGLVAQFVRIPESAGGVALGPRGPLDLFDAARLAVHAHALAGERWARERGASAGLLAHELADLLPACLESLRA